MAIKICPMCKGRPRNDVFSRLISRTCELCAGRGRVDTELKCVCGRPAVHKINTMQVCTRMECQKIAFEQKSA